MTYRLKVRNFGCLEEIDIEYDRFTIIIGKQAAGKSLLSKLSSFFLDRLRFVVTSFDDILSVSDVKKDACDDFINYFPPFMWGNKIFSIEFECSDLKIHMTGSCIGGRRHNVKIEISPILKKLVVSARKEYKNYIEEEKAESRNKETNIHYYRAERRVRQRIEEKFIELTGYSSSFSFFVPAGRAFYSSVLRAVSVAEGEVDLFTKEFGRAWANIFHPGYNKYIASKKKNRQDDKLRDIVGGTIEVQKNKSFLKTSDSREVPLHFLSSGQQELLPLWVMISEFSGLETPVSFFVEEPEAHLFPDAQLVVTSYLSSLVCRNFCRGVFVTTHSPYVLAVVNVLILAGRIGKSAEGELKSKIGKIVDVESWLPDGVTRAYAIVDGRAINLIDDSGLIDAAYIDQTSNKLNQMFSDLLEFENGAE